MSKLKLIQQTLFQGKTTSFHLLQHALITYRNTTLKNPIATISPMAEQQAKNSDQQRKKGLSKGLLDGIPTLIKDNIMYADGTPTTANSYALKHFVPTSNAPIVDALLKAGAVILGKANLSEFAYFMGDEKMPSGYGSMYGQVKHPIDENIDPYGSSTGSAVAVALDIVPVAIGTETNGSLMAPAFQTQIVSFKPTVGMVSQTGIIPIAPSQDTAGPMAKSVFDCAVVMDVIAFAEPSDSKTITITRPSSFVSILSKPITKKRIGYVHFSNQPYEVDDQTILQQTKAKWKTKGHEVVDITMELPPLDNYPTLLREFKISLNAFLQQHHQKGMPKNLKDIIQFNLDHSDRCLRYGQATLLESEKMPSTLGADYDKLYQHVRTEASKFQETLVAKQLDVLITPTWLGFAPIYGNPSLCLPMGYLNGKPKGIILVGKLGHDQALLHIGHKFYDIESI
jgi:amidase